MEALLGILLYPKGQDGSPFFNPLLFLELVQVRALACLLSHPEVEAHGVTEAALSLGVKE